jgi:hypothetical protein
MPINKDKPYAALSNHTGVGSKTIRNWAKQRPELYQIILEHFEMSKNPDCTLNYVRAKLNSKQENNYE